MVDGNGQQVGPAGQADQSPLREHVQTQQGVGHLRHTGLLEHPLQEYGGGSGRNFFRRHGTGQNPAHVRDLVLPSTDLEPLVDLTVLFPGGAAEPGLFRVEPLLRQQLSLS